LITKEIFSRLFLSTGCRLYPHQKNIPAITREKGTAKNKKREALLTKINFLKLNFFKESPAVFLCLWIKDKNPAAFANNFLRSIRLFFHLTTGKRSPATDTLTLRKQPSLNWGNNIFKHMSFLVRFLLIGGLNKIIITHLTVQSQY